MLFKALKLLAIAIGVSHIVYGQSKNFQKDSIQISVDSAEHIFLNNNLLLLAQQYNISVQKAQIIQAQLYPNPNFNFSHGFYHPELKQFFASGTDGEFATNISQVILLARKRNKQIQLAKTNAEIAEFQYYELIRTLKYTLRQDFYNIYYLQNSSKVYESEINSLQQVADAFESQKGKGYISEKEVVRIKAQLYSLQSEYNDLINQINDIQSELRMILQLKNVFINPIVDDQLIKTGTPEKYSITALLDTAYEKRMDLKIAKSTIVFNNQNYDLQKALAVPDITIQMGYDKQGSYIHNFNSLGFGIDIPIFNRNQGNIKAAKETISISKTLQKLDEFTIEEQIERAYQKAIDNEKMIRKIDPGFQKDFDKLVIEVINNYKKRNIGLLEFIDFYDSYKQNTIQLNTITFNKISALEDINFYTANTFYN